MFAKSPNIRFMLRVQEGFESRGLRTMLNSGTIDFDTADRAFTYACRHNNNRIAEVLVMWAPTRYWFYISNYGHINRYQIIQDI